jgi:hypothetical protein
MRRSHRRLFAFAVALMTFAPGAAAQETKPIPTARPALPDVQWKGASAATGTALRLGKGDVPVSFHTGYWTSLNDGDTDLTICGAKVNLNVWIDTLGSGTHPSIGNVTETPTIVSLTAGKTKYWLLIDRDLPDATGWRGWRVASATAAEFKADSETFRIVDADMDGVFGEHREDMLLSYDTNTLCLFRGEAWTEEHGHRVKVEKGQIYTGQLPVPPIKPLTEADCEKALCLMNSYRQRGGIDAVWMDQTLSDHVRLHCEWMDKNGRFSHPEQPGTPGYTQEGHNAGMASVLGTGVGSLIDGMTMQILTAFHRQQVLDPRVQVTGFGHVGKYFGPRSCSSMRPWSAPCAATWPSTLACRRMSCSRAASCTTSAS